MAVRIRLRRVGRKKQSSFRIVVADKDAPRDGAYVESLGFYNPRRQPAELRLDLEKVESWLSKGAEPSDTVAALIRKARKGGDTVVGLYSAEEVAAARKAEQRGSAPPAAKPRRGAKKATEAEPSTETEAKADPEVMAEAHAQSDEPTAEPTGEAPATVEAPEAAAGDTAQAVAETPAGEEAAGEEAAGEEAAGDEAAGGEAKKTKKGARKASPDSATEEAAGE